MLTITNEDCADLMARYPDKHFDLAIVDPPYGIGENWKRRNKGPRFETTTYKNKSIPPRAYFDELFRVSKNQIIWGYNYFTEILGPTNYLIVWDKMSSTNKVVRYSKCEIAYTTIKIPCNIFAVPWDGSRMGKETGNKRIHPHQKPIELYENLLIGYARCGDIILDTHFGSGSIAIACHELGFDLTACEIDKAYFDRAMERIETYQKQQTLFDHKELHAANAPLLEEMK
jgi:site-specific DNA-methyltransferase (adenine-specific)